MSADGAHWFLINASPNLAVQIESLTSPHSKKSPRQAGPVEAILLTNADLDHTLGLFLLREGGPLTIHAAAAVREVLCQSLRLEQMLQAFCGVRWGEPSEEFAPLSLRHGPASGLSARVIRLPADKPSFARHVPVATDGLSVAWQILEDTTGARALIAPHVSQITAPLRAAMDESDVVLFDGTFWSDDELQQVKPTARTARQMGHVPVRESLATVATMRAPRKILVHINNTNPMLAPESSERRQVEEAGVVIGEDGWEAEV